MAWTIIYTYHAAPLHLEHLRKSNPKSQIIPLHLKHNLPEPVIWRTSDKIVRELIKNIIDIIYYDNILLIEWDIYINTEVPVIEFDGMLAKYNSTDQSNGWIHWQDVAKFPKEYLPYIASSPLWGFTGIKLKYLKQLLDPKYDEIYDMDIFCEIRSATLVASMGGTVTQYPYEWREFLLTGPGTEEFVRNELIKNPDKQGFFHPVKYTMPMQP